MWSVFIYTHRQVQLISKLIFFSFCINDDTLPTTQRIRIQYTQARVIFVKLYNISNNVQIEERIQLKKKKNKNWTFDYPNLESYLESGRFSTNNLAKNAFGSMITVFLIRSPFLVCLVAFGGRGNRRRKRSDSGRVEFGTEREDVGADNGESSGLHF